MTAAAIIHLPLNPLSQVIETLKWMGCVPWESLVIVIRKHYGDTLAEIIKRQRSNFNGSSNPTQGELVNYSSKIPTLFPILYSHIKNTNSLGIHGDYLPPTTTRCHSRVRTLPQTHSVWRNLSMAPLAITHLTWLEPIVSSD